MGPPHSTPLEAKPQDRATARGYRGAEGRLPHAAGRRPGRPAAADSGRFADSRRSYTSAERTVFGIVPLQDRTLRTWSCSTVVWHYRYSIAMPDWSTQVLLYRSTVLS